MVGFLNLSKRLLQVIVFVGVFAIPLIWSRYLNANYVSAKFFLVFLISSLSLFLTSSKWVFPKLPKALFASLISLCIAQVSFPLFTGHWEHIYFIFKFLSFAFFAYYFYTAEIDLPAFLKKWDLVFFITAVLILVFAMSDFYHIRIEKLDVKSGLLLGSFGNVNMLAEFLILSLPLVRAWQKTPTKTLAYFKDFVFFGWLFFIFYCRSRSAWIGLCLWTFWLLYQRELKWKDFALMALAFAFFQASFYAPAIVEEAVNLNAKGESFGQRLHLYKMTLRLILDNPIGVGVGQFYNEIVPYLVQSDFRPFEYLYFDQPHSEILKWAVQFGWLGFIFPTLVIYGLAFKALKEKNFFLTSSLCVFLPQIAFQFPFENPASLTYLAFIFALALGLFPIAKRKSISLLQRLPIFVVAIAGVLHAVFFVTSVFLETSHNNKIELIEFSCQIYPINVNACFVRDQYLVGTNRMFDARSALRQDFSIYPYHAGLMRIFPAYLKSTNNNQKICEAVLMYDYVFQNQSFFKEDVLKVCNEFRLPFTHQSPEQFKKDYLMWQQGLL